MITQKAGRVLLPLAGKYLNCQCLCQRGLSAFGELRSYFRQLEGGSVELIKDDISGIATIMMNNPTRKNAFSGKMMVDLDDCVSELEKWNAGKCVILAGQGGTFCSGGDLETVQRALSDGEGMCKLMQNVTSRLFNLSLISVAAVDGHALGGGAELLTACDFRVVKPSSKIGFVQVKLNVATGWGGCTRLVGLLGRTKALHVLTSGLIMDAEKAYHLGLINEILEEDGDVVELGKKWLTKNCLGNIATTRVIKQMVLAGHQLDQAQSLQQERQLFCQVWGKQAHLEALSKNKKHK